MVFDKETDLFGRFDWSAFAAAIRVAVRFLDDVVSVNTYVPAIKELRDCAWAARRIGLGVMGLADLLFCVGARYGSRDGLVWCNDLAEFLQYHAMQASIELSRERGPFPAITGSIFDPCNIAWAPVQFPMFGNAEGEQHVDTGKPELDWLSITDGICRDGIRNAAVTTVAPTGTIGTVAGVEGYGLEPAFALSFSRWVTQPDGSRLELRYASRLFGRALALSGIAEDSEAAQDVLSCGSCQLVPGLTEEIRRVFVTAADVSVQGHIHTQAVWQQYLSNSISKTINFPANATEDDVREAYLLAHRLHCRGLTVYVADSRPVVVLQAGSSK